ncbi:hypothetical protein HY837_01620 [archaeon]|nr:hypothetical protein [archaeon]
MNENLESTLAKEVKLNESKREEIELKVQNENKEIFKYNEIIYAKRKILLQLCEENYPGLIKKEYGTNFNVTYSAETPLKTEESRILRETISDIDNEKLKNILEKGTLKISDLVLSMTNLEIKEQVNSDYSELKQINNDLVTDLRKQFNAEQEFFIERKKIEKDWTYHDTKYFSVGLVSLLDLGPLKKGLIEATQKLENRIAEYNKNPVEVSSFEEQYPNFPYSVFYLVTGIISAFAVPLVHSLIKKYRKDQEWSTGEFFYSGINGFLGIFSVDMVHPVVFYTRVGLPIVWEMCKGLKK